MTSLFNWLGYQLVWLCAVYGASHGHALLGPTALALFAIMHLARAHDVRGEMRLMFAAVLLGMLLDGTLSWLGWLQYAGKSPAFPPDGAPLWILSLWAAFALTLNHSLGFLRPRPWLAVLFGALGGPLAYLLAARSWGAVRFTVPAWHGLLVLALGWTLAMPLLAMLARHWMRKSHRAAPMHLEAGR